ncbi:hypothetical protein LINPERPRIM_LOCUS30343 [Linum perenne]
MLSLCCNAVDPTHRLTATLSIRRGSPLPGVPPTTVRSDRLRSVTLFGRCDSADGRFDELLPS